MTILRPLLPSSLGNLVHNSSPRVSKPSSNQSDKSVPPVASNDKGRVSGDPRERALLGSSATALETPGEKTEAAASRVIPARPKNVDAGAHKEGERLESGTAKEGQQGDERPPSQPFPSATTGKDGEGEDLIDGAAESCSPSMTARTKATASKSPRVEATNDGLDAEAGHEKTSEEEEDDDIAAEDGTWVLNDNDGDFGIADEAQTVEGPKPVEDGAGTPRRNEDGLHDATPAVGGEEEAEEAKNDAAEGVPAALAPNGAEAGSDGAAGEAEGNLGAENVAEDTFDEKDAAQLRTELDRRISKPELLARLKNDFKCPIGKVKHGPKPGMIKWIVETLSEFSMADLREEARKRELEVEGTKKDLILRIVAPDSLLKEKEAVSRLICELKPLKVTVGTLQRRLRNAGEKVGKNGRASEVLKKIVTHLYDKTEDDLRKIARALEIDVEGAKSKEDLIKKIVMAG